MLWVVREPTADPLDFASPRRTDIVPYCSRDHMNLSAARIVASKEVTSVSTDGNDDAGPKKLDLLTSVAVPAELVKRPQARALLGAPL